MILDPEGNLVEFTPEEVKCECGSEKAGSPAHSHYCPLFGIEIKEPLNTVHAWGTFNSGRGCFPCDRCGYEAFPDSFGSFSYVPPCPGKRP